MKIMLDDVGWISFVMVISFVNEEWMVVCFGVFVFGNIKEVMDNEDWKYRVLWKNDKICVDFFENFVIFFVLVVLEDNVVIVFLFILVGYIEKELVCLVVF